MWLGGNGQNWPASSIFLKHRYVCKFCLVFLTTVCIYIYSIQTVKSVQRLNTLMFNVLSFYI